MHGEEDPKTCQLQQLLDRCWVQAGKFRSGGFRCSLPMVMGIDVSNALLDVSMAEGPVHRFANSDPEFAACCGTWPVRGRRRRCVNQAVNRGSPPGHREGMRNSDILPLRGCTV